MQFLDTGIVGGYLVVPNKLEDERGYFARAWCAAELKAAGLNTHIEQLNMAVTEKRLTLRGLHFQSDPYKEVKFVRCVRGLIFDVMVDLRKGSPSYLNWYGTELSPENAFALYVPEGCATGYLTLQDDTEIYYHTSCSYAPEYAGGVRWDDPTFAIEWPEQPLVISEQDRNWLDFSDSKTA